MFIYESLAWKKERKARSYAAGSMHVRALLNFITQKTMRIERRCASALVAQPQKERGGAQFAIDRIVQQSYFFLTIIIV